MAEKKPRPRLVSHVVMQRGGVGVSLNLLYALDGAIRGIRWDYLPKDHRDALRRSAETPES